MGMNVKIHGKDSVGGLPQEVKSTTNGIWVNLRDSSGAEVTSLGATEVTGISRNRIIQVLSGTLPVLATSGVATWLAPGVRGIVIKSVRVVSGTPPLTANTNWAVRYAIDSANDAADAILLPTTTPSPSATADIGQVGAFNLRPIIYPSVADATRQVELVLADPNGVFIDVSAGITRLSFAHNIGGSVLLEFVIQAVEVV